MKEFSMARQLSKIDPVIEILDLWFEPIKNIHPPLTLAAQFIIFVSMISSVKLDNVESMYKAPPFEAYLSCRLEWI